MSMSTKDIYNFVKVDDQIVTAGQPTEDELKSAATEGFATVINLAPHDSRNALPDEAGLVQSLGMTYHHIPVIWENPKDSDFSTFEQVMRELPPGKTLIHCAANFRVTAFYSLYAQKQLGWSEAQADQFRAAIWKGSNYPIWEKFIAQMKAKLNGKA